LGIETGTVPRRKDMKRPTVLFGVAMKDKHGYFLSEDNDGNTTYATRAKAQLAFDGAEEKGTDKKIGIAKIIIERITE
jgi:hypothetical protein